MLHVSFWYQTPKPLTVTRLTNMDWGGTMTTFYTQRIWARSHWQMRPIGWVWKLEKSFFCPSTASYFLGNWCQCQHVVCCPDSWGEVRGKCFLPRNCLGVWSIWPCCDHTKLESRSSRKWTTCGKEKTEGSHLGKYPNPIEGPSPFYINVKGMFYLILIMLLLDLILF